MNQNSFTWNKFRLSWFIMNSTLSHSTHFRATCNFNSDGLVTTDYLRAKTTELNILLLKGGPCVTLEYINIRGHDCHNCSVWMTQEPNGWPLHIDSHYAADHCSFKSAKNGSIGGWGEDNFGFYLTVNPLHRCSSGNHSTTQWWFGEQWPFPSQQMEYFNSLCNKLMILVFFFFVTYVEKPFLSATFLLTTKGRRLYTIIPNEEGITIAFNALPFFHKRGL